MKKKSLLLTLCMAVATTAFAQLSTNPDKFLGNITTRGQVNGGGIEFASLWNQITPENESKWASIEGTRGNYNWGGCDNAYNYAKNHNFPFKFHTLVWGSQYPGWMDGLSEKAQLRAVTTWMNQVKRRYPNLDMIDVVNEAIPGHAPAPFKNALGGDGVTGYDWIIKAFEMAHELWPDAILIYNDFNTFRWQKTEFINLVKTLRDAGAPIDAYGCQSHDLTDMDFTSFKSAMTEIQTALKMPMYSTEYDIGIDAGTDGDAKQLQQYKNQIKYMWEQSYVAGITLWGYIYGATWTTNGNSGIIRNGVDRPAMTWLREYMASDAAKSAKSPFPGMKKEASVYIKPVSLTIEMGTPSPITINARLRTKTIEKVEFYVNSSLISTLTEAPYVVDYTPTRTGTQRLKAVVYDTDGNTYTRQQELTVVKARQPFKGVIADIPGVLEAENFDAGTEGQTYHDSNTNREGDAASYRVDTGIDIVKGNGGYAVGYTNAGEWMEYTVNVTEPGEYSYEAVVSSGADNSGFTIGLVENGAITALTDNIAVPNGGTWDTYRTMTGKLLQNLDEGKHIIRISITGSSVNIDNIKFICTLNTGVKQIVEVTAGTYEIFTPAGTRLGTVVASGNSDLRQKARSLAGDGLFIMKNVENGTVVKMSVK